MAQTEANIDKTTYVVFRIYGKIYHSKLDCWNKSEDKGDLLMLVLPQ